MDECCICIEKIEDDVSKCTLPGCGHKFHVSCILSVMQYDTRCPMCRENIPNVKAKKDESESPVLSLEEIYNEYQRKKREYNYKKRKIINKNEILKKNIDTLKLESKELNKLEDQLDKLWSQKSRRLWKEDEELSSIKETIQKQRRKCNRINKKIKDTIEPEIGEVPSFDDGLETLFPEIF